MRSLRYILPAILIVMALVMVSVSMINAVVLKQSDITRKATDDIKRDAIHLSRFAEQSLHINPQLLEDDITVKRTDERVSAGAVITSKGKVLFGTDFSWRNKEARDVLPYFDYEIMQETLQTRQAFLRLYDDQNFLVVFMSFNMYGTSESLRDFDKGLIFLGYDLSHERNQVLKDVLIDQSFVIFISLITALVFYFISNRYIIEPLRDLSYRAKEIAQGNFKNNIVENGMLEVKELNSAFNFMSDNLQGIMQTLSSEGERTKAIIDNVVDGIITIDREGVIESFNPAAENIFGYNANDVIGRKVNMLMPLQYSEHHDEFIRNYLITREPKIIGIGREVEGLRQNGEIFPMELAVADLMNRGKQLFVGIVRDITERKRVDRIKNDFISTVSHELRTPLTSINGAVALLNSGKICSLTDQAKDLLKMAHRNGESLLTLINDLLDMDKILAGKLILNIKEYDLDVLIDRAIELNQLYAQKYNVEFKKVYEQKSLIVKVDDQRFIQVMSNLFSNASKFSNDGDSIEIHVDPLGDFVKISVIDHGIGIPGEYKDSIFKKFTQVDSSSTRKRGGTGLGLAISKELVEMMGGEIAFDSKYGEGTVFYFTIPVESDKA